MNRTVPIVGGIALAIIAVLVYSSAFTVNMMQQAIVLQFGSPQGGVISEPGLHWKMPFVAR